MNTSPKTDFVYLDLETIPQESLRLDDILKEIKAPANLKDPEKIKAARQEKALEALDKASFDALNGRILSIGYAINQDEPEVLYAQNPSDEKGMLEQFFASAFPALVGTSLRKNQRVIGFNIIGFDLPFLVRRALILGVKLPQNFPGCNVREWDERILDLMLIYCGRDKWVSQDKLCKALGLPTKNGFDGSMIKEAHRTGKHQQIKDYNLDDVRIVQALHARMVQCGLC